MKNKKGFTLLEAVIALALWLVLSAGVFFAWQHSAQSSAMLFERQNAFENARISMDAIIMNFQMARRINLQTDGRDVLQTLTLNQHFRDGSVPRNCLGGRPWNCNETHFANYTFSFNANASPTSVRFQRLEFGNNEFAENIAEIIIQYVDGRMEITITTGCDEPIVLEGSVCVRYKCLVVNGVIIHCHM
jgi:type II secretory pathway pseudopilin PulG